LVTTAKHLLIGLLVSVTLAAPGAGTTVRDEALGFEFSLPKELDWQRCAVKPKTARKAHFKTFEADAQPPWEAEVMLLVWEAKPKGTLKEEAESLRPTFEHTLTETERRKKTEAKLDGEPCAVVDVVGKGGRARFHLTWRVARCGGRLYVLFVRRQDAAIEDAELEKEIARIVGTFRFLRPKAPPPAAKPQPTPPEAPAPSKAYCLAHWRLECVKPSGLKEVPPEELDKANGVILRFEGHAEQSRCLVRIYAHLRSRARLSLDKLAREKIARFEEKHKKRLDPVQGAWKPPLARKGLRLELIARKLTPETTRWYLADCRNDRRYQIEIITTGQAWEAQVAALLAGFVPRRRLR
jgi:hypothetical protein